MKTRKLVLFDIDGTLLNAVRVDDNLNRFPYALKKVFGVDVGLFTGERFHANNYNGMGDRYILWDLLKGQNISRDHFVDRIGELGEAFVEYLNGDASAGPRYRILPDAPELVDRIIAAEHLSEGLLTGNLGQSANWKLTSVGLPVIAFGIFGHEADHRNDLARLVPVRAEKYFSYRFPPEDIVVIGDTVRDVECARAIGATAIIVSTGWEVKATDFTDVPPDLHVDSLMDKAVLDLLRLES